MLCRSKDGRTLPYLYENAALSEFFLFRIFCPSLAVCSSLGSFLWISGKSKPFFILIMASLASLSACNDKYQSLVFWSVETWIPFEILRIFSMPILHPKAMIEAKNVLGVGRFFSWVLLWCPKWCKTERSFQHLPINLKWKRILRVKIATNFA